MVGGPQSARRRYHPASASLCRIGQLGDHQDNAVDHGAQAALSASIPLALTRTKQAGIAAASRNETDDFSDTIDIEAALPATALDLFNKANPLRFARECGLNKKQTLAFLRIALAQLDHEQQAKVPPLHILVAGRAGCGKSVVLNTVTRWMSARGRTGQLRLTASTGTAAAKIKGMTLHSLVGISKSASPDEAADDGDGEGADGVFASSQPSARVREETRHLTLLLCDEVSMIGHKVFSTAN